MNTSKTGLSEVGIREIGFLLSKAQSAASYTGITYQTAQNLFADLYAQYFATTATYFNSDRYVIRQDWITTQWSQVYVGTVPQLLSIMANTDSTSAEHAIAKIWWVWAFHRTTDYYGPIPYFSAGHGTESVPYDAQDKIYSDFFTKLDEALAVLEASTSETSTYGTYDLIYHGDISKWITFGNTLKLRLAMRVSKVEPELARQKAEEAVAAGVMETAGTYSVPQDDAYMNKPNLNGDANGLAYISSWGEFRMSAAMESVLKGYDDPRIGKYYSPAAKTGTYEGLRNGYSSTELSTLVGNGADDNSNPGPLLYGNNFTNITALTRPQDIMHSAEAYFIRAEGALLGWNMGGTAQELYGKGIRASLIQWGIIDENVIAAYINSANIPIAPDDAVHSPALSNTPIKWASDKTTQLIQIATQKWLALYPDGVEAWADLRRSDQLKLYDRINSDNADLPVNVLIKRLPFLTSDAQSNAAAVEAAKSLLDGSDSPATPLWWDK
ncbi:SusD/RagB family nutrient-binding outer membrane lipoprotein [Xanthocytophaga flava]|uniref:SusD/RagB family nutrient-binding outer membrane lipoprotein n=1 Tax=Xanthocytophaga flava TaxID=3048013 RepID=UPI0028D37525|nr:SusD/RagB family nutrient-binding outer membrane lipoprotein [Xanthocytophaga flavus]MDJ1466629.1 SusD/RagB family nutrient-binding outer membrane lipoprotein [Xanthocytophaga flavus]